MANLPSTYRKEKQMPDRRSIAEQWRDIEERRTAKFLADKKARQEQWEKKAYPYRDFSKKPGRYGLHESPTSKTEKVLRDATELLESVGYLVSALEDGNLLVVDPTYDPTLVSVDGSVQSVPHEADVTESYTGPEWRRVRIKRGEEHPRYKGSKNDCLT
jgi:hypothetical protein